MPLPLSTIARELIIDSAIAQIHISDQSTLGGCRAGAGTFAPGYREDYACRMKRELMALALMIVIGLQGSMAAFAAASSVGPADCRPAAMAHPVASQGPGASQDSCCPRGLHAMSCCLDLCLQMVAPTMSPAALTLFIPPSELQAAASSIFSSRGDSPLIRPPILE